MLWIVQDNLYNEAGYVKFIEALERLDVDFLVVKPIPFTNIIMPASFDSVTQNVEDTPEPYIDTSDKIIAFGATSLSRIAKEKGWNPGTYLTDNFDFEIWRDGFGKENILNPESIVTRICDPINVINMSETLFVRPVHDLKAFTGTTMSKYDFFDWVQSISMIEEEEFQPLHKNTKIAIANYKKIYAEYRIFVVDGNVITGSLYKRGTEVIHEELNDVNVLAYAAQMVKCWQPAPAFVIDVALTEDGYKVIEINTINSAGFYAADPQKIIAAIETMENR